jgi:endogenous inhibitor of DNA gyrase (YacG/DUF329 family)
MDDDSIPCTVCGKPVLWGTRCAPCGQRVHMGQGAAGVSAVSASDVRGMFKDAEAPAPHGSLRYWHGYNAALEEVARKLDASGVETSAKGAR